jgi:hypothetical protein
MKIMTIGKRLISADQVAFVERFDPNANPGGQAREEL